MTALHVHDLGRLDYDAALDRQRDMIERVRSAKGDEAHLLLVEHNPPVITLGRRGRRSDILASPEELAARGIEVRPTTRGGEVTWHGPGQLVGYPILRLDPRERTVRRHVRNLEETLIRTAGRFGVDAHRKHTDGNHVPVNSRKNSNVLSPPTERPDRQRDPEKKEHNGRRPRFLTGVWVGEAKLAAIGVTVRRWVSYHGFALNVCCDLSHFDRIVPCGLPDVRTTSLAALLGRSLSLENVKPVLLEEFRSLYGFRIP
jgi:lipoate-protein ligase B